MRPLRTHSNKENSYVGTLPTGCQYCKNGEKLVLFVTGKCHQACYYCPVSKERWQQDVSFANEMQVTSLEEIIQEARLMDAKGAGITGGDPLLETEKVVQWIKGLKSTFGQEFHIHLYTSDREITRERLDALFHAGLDEIRLHPKLYQDWSHLDAIFDLVLSYPWSVGSEIPAIPGTEEEIIRYAHFLEKKGVKFLNLNELEFTPANGKRLRARGFIPLSGTNVVSGSKSTALKVLSAFQESSHTLTVHFCSSRFKDAIQLRNRFKRRAHNIKRAFDEITEDGLLWYGILETMTPELLQTVIHALLEDYNLEPWMYEQVSPTVLHLPWYVVEELASQLHQRFPKQLVLKTVQQHPTAQGLIVLEEPF